MNPHTPARRRRRAAAFTLIELLTVIAIIGILAAIIIPVAGKVRQSARLSRCLSNHRQVAASYLLYLGDNRDMLWLQKNPQHTSSGQANNGVWGSMFGAQADSNNPGYLCTLLERYGLRRAKWDGWQAIPDRAQTVWYCPLTISNDAVAGHGATYRYYYLGQHIGVTDRPVPALRVADYWSAKPFLADHYGDHGDASRTNAPTTESVRNVYAFLDGHVAYRAP